MEHVTFDLKSTSDTGPGTFEGVMSSPVLDRDGEIIDAFAFAPLPKHIPIDIDHGLTVEKTVGSGEPFYDKDGNACIKGTFSSTPLGQQVRTLVKEGHIRHMSVAFRGAVRELDEESGITHIRKGELINCTITGIPANMATAVVAKVGARNAAKDLERLQATHDHMVELGAKCEGKHARGITFGGGVTTRPGAYIVGAIGPETRYVIASDGINGAVNKYVTAEEFAAIKAAHKSTDTDTPTAAADEAAPAGAEVDVARAIAELALTEAILALD